MLLGVVLWSVRHAASVSSCAVDGAPAVFCASLPIVPARVALSRLCGASKEVFAPFGGVRLTDCHSLSDPGLFSLLFCWSQRRSPVSFCWQSGR